MMCNIESTTLKWAHHKQSNMWSHCYRKTLCELHFKAGLDHICVDIFLMVLNFPFLSFHLRTQNDANQINKLVKWGEEGIVWFAVHMLLLLWNWMHGWMITESHRINNHVSIITYALHCIALPATNNLFSPAFTKSLFFPKGQQRDINTTTKYGISWLVQSMFNNRNDSLEEAQAL